MENLTLKIYTNPYGTRYRLFRNATITLKPGVTVLVGCNGYGKTTFIQNVIDALHNTDTPHFHYDNLRDGGSAARSRSMFTGAIEMFATQMQSSEGENILMNLGPYFAAPIRRMMNDAPDAESYVVLVDSIDSGLSIDKIDEVKVFLTQVLLKDVESKGKSLYIVLSTNSYEFCTGDQFNCYDVYTGQYIDIDDYEAYRAFVSKSRKKVDKRYESEDKA